MRAVGRDSRKRADPTSWHFGRRLRNGLDLLDGGVARVTWLPGAHQESRPAVLLLLEWHDKNASYGLSLSWILNHDGRPLLRDVLIVLVPHSYSLRERLLVKKSKKQSSLCHFHAGDRFVPSFPTEREPKGVHLPLAYCPFTFAFSSSNRCFFYYYYYYRTITTTNEIGFDEFESTANWNAHTSLTWVAINFESNELC